MGCLAWKSFDLSVTPNLLWCLSLSLSQFLLDTQANGKRRDSMQNIIKGEEEGTGGESGNLESY
jgi:hypothetical protein